MTKDKSPPSLNYREAGVDIDRGNSLVEFIKPLAAATQKQSMSLSAIGGFGALFQVPSGYQQPVLVAGTDGVGTKLRLAMQWQNHSTIGIDLVAMCANDILVQGAKPLFFLDYFATGQIDLDMAKAVLQGIAEACQQCDMALIGGETAEMPGFYHGNDYDLAGFCVGIVEKNRIIDGGNVKPGDILIGLASTGPHSNGYSLIRKIIERANAKANTPVDGNNLAGLLLAPTQLYVKPILSLLDEIPIHAMAHITGGGLLENIPRVMPEHYQAVIKRSAWPQAAIFSWLQQHGNVAENEMLRTFNCGIGMVLCLDPQYESTCLQHLQKFAISAWTIGHVIEHATGGINIQA